MVRLVPRLTMHSSKNQSMSWPEPGNRPLVYKPMQYPLIVMGGSHDLYFGLHFPVN